MVQRMYHDECGGLTREGANQGLFFHLKASFLQEKAAKSMKVAAADCAGGLEGLNSATGALSLSPVRGRTSFYTFGSMTSGGERYGVCTVFASPAGFSTQNGGLAIKNGGCGKQNGRLFSALLG